MTDELAERVHRVESILEIQGLKASYAALVDARYERGGIVASGRLADLSAAAADLFTKDATWDGGPTLGVAAGRDAIAERFANPTLRFSWHAFVNPRIQVRGDQASGVWDLFAPVTDADGDPRWMAGVEHDTYRRVDGRWLHASMRLETTFYAPYETGWQRILR